MGDGCIWLILSLGALIYLAPIGDRLAPPGWKYKKAAVHDEKQSLDQDSF
jgi:hypothetical protein